jgi:hypothetical protein
MTDDGSGLLRQHSIDAVQTKCTVPLTERGAAVACMRGGRVTITMAEYGCHGLPFVFVVTCRDTRGDLAEQGPASRRVGAATLRHMRPRRCR